MVWDPDLLSSSEQFDSSDIDLFQVNNAHAKNFLADVVGFFVDTRDVNDFVRCEVGQNGRSRPDAQIAENCLSALRGHALDKVGLFHIQIKLIDALASFR